MSWVRDPEYSRDRLLSILAPESWRVSPILVPQSVAEVALLLCPLDHHHFHHHHLLLFVSFGPFPSPKWSVCFPERQHPAPQLIRFELGSHQVLSEVHKDFIIHYRFVHRLLVFSSAVRMEIVFPAA
jgi:hypothetical protein